MARRINDLLLLLLLLLFEGEFEDRLVRECLTNRSSINSKRTR